MGGGVVVDRVSLFGSERVAEAWLGVAWVGVCVRGERPVAAVEEAVCSRGGRDRRERCGVADQCGIEVTAMEGFGGRIRVECGRSCWQADECC